MRERLPLFLISLALFLAPHGRLLAQAQISKGEIEKALLFNELAQVGTAGPTQCGSVSSSFNSFNSKVSIDLDSDPNNYHKEVSFDFSRKVKRVKFQGDEVSVLSEQEAKRLFKLFSELEYLKFDYLHDGCFARAHELALIAKENGIEMGKVFLSDHSGRASLYPKSWQDNPDAPIPAGFVGWRYHVTPYVLIEKAGQLVPFVFDVGVSPEGQSLQDWQDSLMDPKRIDPDRRKVTYRDRGYVYAEGRSYYPDTSNIKGQIEDQELMRKHGISDFLYYREKGLL